MIWGWRPDFLYSRQIMLAACPRYCIFFVDLYAVNLGAEESASEAR